MHRNSLVGLALLAAACVPATPGVATAPASSAATCSKGSSEIAYVIDGTSATCESAMAIAADRIASVEVLNGDAAVSLYGRSARAGVVVIQTKR